MNVVAVSPGYVSASRRFKIEPPDLSRVPLEPLVSCLCVTENRQAFIPWLLWNFDRQTWRRRELVIVDSSNPPIRDPGRKDVRVIRVPSGTWLGAKRNLALEAARGQVVAWFDDDDWQHSARLSYLVPMLRKHATRTGASFIGPSRSYFLDLYSNRIQPYVAKGYAIFNGSVYYTAMVRSVPFPENILRTEDTVWISRLLRHCRGVALEGDQPTLFMWLSHDANISNLRSWRHSGARNYLDPSLWQADCPNLQRHLAALRERLEKFPAQPPRRAVLLEGASLERNREPRDAMGHVAGHPSAPRATDNRRVLESSPRRASSDQSTLTIYAASSSGSAELSKRGFLLPPRVKTSFGEGDVPIAITSQLMKQRTRNEYVGVLKESFIRKTNVTRAALARKIETGRRKCDVYGFAPSVGLTLGKHLADQSPLILSVFSHVVLHRMGKPHWILDNKLPIFEEGFITRPTILLRMVQQWLIVARARLSDGFDAELSRILGGQALRSCGEAVLQVIPAVFFQLEHCTVGHLEPSAT